MAQGEFSKGRVAHVAAQFAPISLKSLFSGKPTTFIAPTSKGASRGTIVNDMVKVLRVYAEPRLWEKVENENAEDELINLMPEIVRSARLNGVNPEEAYKRARASVLGEQYKEFFKELNSRKRPKQLERVAAGVIRLHGALDALHASMEGRLKVVDRDYPIEMQEAAEEAFLTAEEGF